MTGRDQSGGPYLVGNPLGDLTEGVDRLLNVLVITDDDVEAGNRVTRSDGFPADEHGPIAKVSFDHRNRSARTVANRDFLTGKAVELLRAAGATSVHHIRWPPLILHVQSTMRMGLDPSDSVLDASGEARFVRRLFVGDNAALANGIGGPNPTLTSQALATRTAERIFQRYFDGDPWVGVEAPVSSIDDAVTRAVIDADLGEEHDGLPAPAPEDGPVTPVTGGGAAVLAGAAALAAGEALRRAHRTHR